jgi:uncharacterized protein
MTTTFDPTADNTERREVMKGGMGAAIVAAFAGPIAALATRDAEASLLDGADCVAGGTSNLVSSPYGACVPTNDLTTGLPLIQLPPGFSYRSFSWRGDLMSDGKVCPGNHDGMGVVRSRRVGRSTELTLIRNHELSGAGVLSGVAGNATHIDSSRSYDNTNCGGTSTLVWRDGQWVESYLSFGGGIRNCAGGSSTWGSWLTNEEPGSGLTVNNLSGGKLHGYVFEVPADGTPNVNPIRDMGRMSHEASAIDPETGYWYLTEDAVNTLYRFRPTNIQGGVGSLHQGGILEGLAVQGTPNADLRAPSLCQEFQCVWVAIADPDANAASSPVGNASGPYRQAYANGAARFGANEGCWVANGIVFFTDKAVSGGRRGRIWALDLDTMVLKCIFAPNNFSMVNPSTGATVSTGAVGNSPDNICVSPRGGLLFCEDGGGTLDPTSSGVVADRLMGLTSTGNAFVFARNNYNFTSAQLAAAGKPGASAGNFRNSEWAGSVFSPDGRVLFVNIQGPGITVAITGPWATGTL